MIDRKAGTECLVGNTVGDRLRPLRDLPATSKNKKTLHNQIYPRVTGILEDPDKEFVIINVVAQKSQPVGIVGHPETPKEFVLINL